MKAKRIIFIYLWLLVPSMLFAQKYVANKSHIRFFSSAPLEDIEANNDAAKSVFNSDNGEFAFSVTISDFKFEKSLMQEHFNEKYMESDKFPTATFKGKTLGYEKKNGTQNVQAQGVMKIHGVEKNVTIPSTIEMAPNQMNVKAKFIVKLEDYDVDRPSIMWQNIAEQVEVTVNFEYKPHEK